MGSGQGLRGRAGPGRCEPRTEDTIKVKNGGCGAGGVERGQAKYM